MQNCKVCGSQKPEDEFYSKDRTCKVCRKEKVRQHRVENLEAVKEYDRNRPNHKERMERNKENYRKRISTPEGRAAEWERASKYRTGPKRAARVLVGNALRNNRITRLEKCHFCGRGPTEAHHEDYYKPLEILWLCKPCHSQRHKEINEQLRSGADLSDKGFT